MTCMCGAEDCPKCFPYTWNTPYGECERCGELDELEDLDGEWLCSDCASVTREVEGTGFVIR